ncbi:MAG: pyrazinamidase/nicotinamidase PncA protein [Methylocystaceae bacterium]|nr:MAG: pyrazinamidase/nicotinamidase PncA protein [Methylocystaceae bacterium]KAF0211298.1 MAG: pyrazinamidase/nicotinamidase PncA [Methylocystaceae bacterium]TXT47447.1 MAG: pyrazinamidase/nicotinamidase PncA protein [Methylocystaceae bacterium]
MASDAMRLTPGDALIVLDVQRDFCAGGALEVSGADKIVSVVNELIKEAVAAGVPIVASRDWHPPGHASFRDCGGPWPAHCVQGSVGAQFHPDLRLPERAIIVSKGESLERDQLSALNGTGLAERLRQLRVRRLLIVGLALDVCVLETALDAVAEGFDTHVRLSGTRAIAPEGARDAVENMRKACVFVEDSQDEI